MTRKDIQAMIRRVLGTGYGDWIKEVAIKCYFYPFASALLSDSEFENATNSDEITVQRCEVAHVVQMFSERLGEIVKSMKLEPETYLSIIVYGMTTAGA